MASMTSIDKLEQKLDERLGRADHAGKLLEQLVDLTAWEYTGEVIDAGEGATRCPNAPRCACEHPIRFVFVIRAVRDVGRWRRGDTTHVGSVCVDQVGHLAPELAEAIRASAERLQQQLAERRAAARRAAQAAEVAALEVEWRRVMDEGVRRYEGYRSKGKMAPQPLWEAVASRRWSLPRSAPEYQRAADYRRWYRAQIDAWQRALECS